MQVATRPAFYTREGVVYTKKGAVYKKHSAKREVHLIPKSGKNSVSVYVRKDEMGAKQSDLATYLAVIKAARVLFNSRPISVQYVGCSWEWKFQVEFAVDKTKTVIVFMPDGEEFAIHIPAFELRKQKPSLYICKRVVKYYFLLQTGRVIDQIHPIGQDHEWSYMATYGEIFTIVNFEGNPIEFTVESCESIGKCALEAMCCDEQPKLQVVLPRRSKPMKEFLRYYRVRPGSITVSSNNVVTIQGLIKKGPWIVNPYYPNKKKGLETFIENLVVN